MQFHWQVFSFIFIFSSVKVKSYQWTRWMTSFSQNIVLRTMSLRQKLPWQPLPSLFWAYAEVGKTHSTVRHHSPFQQQYKMPRSCAAEIFIWPKIKGNVEKAKSKTKQLSWIGDNGKPWGAGHGFCSVICLGPSAWPGTASPLGDFKYGHGKRLQKCLSALWIGFQHELYFG